MKRFHVHVSVENLQDNIRFYSSIFGEEAERTDARKGACCVPAAEAKTNTACC